jgi:ATP-dependent Clp protease ATP-binding subunit ClpA
LQIDELTKRLAERSIALTITDAALALLTTEGYEPEFGARPLKRAIQTFLNVPLAQELLKHPQAHTVHADAREGKMIVTAG